MAEVVAELEGEETEKGDEELVPPQAVSSLDEYLSYDGASFANARELSQARSLPFDEHPYHVSKGGNAAQMYCCWCQNHPPPSTPSRCWVMMVSCMCRIWRPGCPVVARCAKKMR